MIEAVIVLLAFVVFGILWGVIETAKYKKPFSKGYENGRMSTVKSYRMKRRGSWRIFADRILDKRTFREIMEEESKLKIH